MDQNEVDKNSEIISELFSKKRKFDILAVQAAQKRHRFEQEFARAICETGGYNKGKIFTDRVDRYVVIGYDLITFLNVDYIKSSSKDPEETQETKNVLKILGANVILARITKKNTISLNYSDRMTIRIRPDGSLFIVKHELPRDWIDTGEVFEPAEVKK